MQIMLTSKNNLKDDRPQSLKEQMILRTCSWGGVLLWWCKALPTQHSDLTPSSNRPDAAAHTTIFSCQKQAFPKLKHLLVSQLPNFKKGQHITYATKMSKLSENWSWWFWLWNKDELFHGCYSRRDDKRQRVTRGMLKYYFSALLLTEWEQADTAETQTTCK